MNWAFIVDPPTIHNAEAVKTVATMVCDARSQAHLAIIRTSPEGQEIGFDYRQCFATAFERTAHLPNGRSLVAWVMFAQPAGGFLTALLENDLVGAFSRADDQNIEVIKDYVAWLYNDCPTKARGKNLSQWQGLCHLWGWSLLEGYTKVENDG